MTSLRRLPALLACILSGAVIHPAVAAEFAASAYVKAFALALDDVDIEGSAQDVAGDERSLNTLRLMAGWSLDGGDDIEVHYEIQPQYYANGLASAAAGGPTFADAADGIYRLGDIGYVLDEGDKTVIRQNLDRLNYRYSDADSDITLGRQVIAFGSSRFINPTDIFIPFALQTIDQEYRIGIDALRYQRALDAFTLFDAGIIFGEGAHAANNAMFLRYEQVVAGNDIELLFIALHDARLLGGGLERALGDFGFWFEAAYMALDDAVSNDYWRYSVGSDYALNDKVFLMLEYHYNAAGSDEVGDYSQLLSARPHRRFGVQLLGERYLMPAISWSATPLLGVSCSAVFNLDDDSSYLNVAAEYSWSENLYSDIGLQLFTGAGLQGLPPALDFGSEFGALPSNLHLSMRYYF